MKQKMNMKFVHYNASLNPSSLIQMVAMYILLEKMGGIDPDYGYTLVYSDDRQLAAPVHHYMHNNLHLTGGHVGQVGATIGTHIGPRAVGLAFVLAEK